MDEKLNNLIKNQDNHILNGNYQDCLLTNYEIIQILNTLSKENQYEILSKILLSKNQYLYVIIGIFQYLLQNKYIISNDNETKVKYYKLLLSSLKNNKETNNEFIEEKNQLILILEKDILNHISEIEKKINSITININNNTSKIYNGELILTTTASKNSYMILNDQSIITQNITSPLEKSISSFNFEDKKDKSNQIKKISNNDNQKENLSKLYKPNRKLPFIIVNFVANFNSNQLIEKIEKFMSDINFILICHIKENQFENVSAYEYKENNCFKNIINNCFKKNKENNIQQFHITIILKRDENDFSSGVNSFVHDKYERTLLIRTIKGNEKESSEKIFKILKHFSLLVSKIKIIQKSKNFNDYNIEQYLKQYITRKKAELYKEKNLPFNSDYHINFQNMENKKKNENKYKELIEEESFVEKSNIEVGKTLEVYKLLSEKNYSLGKTMSDFIENFKKDYSNINNISENIDTNEIMKKIVKVTEDCVSTFNSSYNIGNETNNLNLNFRESTEQFLWNKIYFILFDIYKKKFNEKNKKFLEKQKEIKDKYNIDEIFHHLDIKNKFRGYEKIPFKVTIELINKIEYEQVPKKKFETLTQSALELRNSILDYTKGKTELESMDDELPLCMYLVTQIKVSNFLAELNLVQDYLQYSLRDKMIQNKVVTNLISSALYIMDSW